MIIILISLFVSLIFSNPVLALTPAPIIDTPEPTISKTPSLEDVQKIREVVQQKVKEKLNQITTLSTSPKSFIGTISQIETNQIIINFNNKQRVLNISEDTVYVDAKRNKSKLEAFKVGQTILAMGYLQENNDTLDTKRIVVTEVKNIENKHKVIVGKIVDISQASPIFVLIPINDKNAQYQIKTDTNTQVFTKTSKKIKVGDLVSGQKIIVVITPDDKITQTFLASSIINFQDTQSSLSPTPTSKSSQ